MSKPNTDDRENDADHEPGSTGRTDSPVVTQQARQRPDKEQRRHASEDVFRMHALTHLT